jgi:hypothetical protein
LAVSKIARPPFDAGPEPLEQWIQGLRKGGVRHAAPALILALEGLRQAEIPAEQRLAFLRLLKKPLLKTCPGLPKPWTARREPNRLRGLSLEQRLYRLMFQNLHQTLHELDRSQFLLDEQEMERHDWVISNLFRFFQRQVRYATLWETPMAENAWRDLHELYGYLTIGRVPVAEAEAPARSHPRADGLALELDYKRLLLFGLAGSLSAPWARSGVVMEGLPRWARKARLEEPEAMQGGLDLFLVEICEDSPPHRKRGPLDRDFRGWVLVPPGEFMDRLGEVIKGA